MEGGVSGGPGVRGGHGRADSAARPPCRGADAGEQVPQRQHDQGEDRVHLLRTLLVGGVGVVYFHGNRFPPHSYAVSTVLEPNHF